MGLKGSRPGGSAGRESARSSVQPPKRSRSTTEGRTPGTRRQRSAYFIGSGGERIGADGFIRGHNTPALFELPIDALLLCHAQIGPMLTEVVG